MGERTRPFMAHFHSVRWTTPLCAYRGAWEEIGVNRVVRCNVWQCRVVLASLWLHLFPSAVGGPKWYGGFCMDMANVFLKIDDQYQPSFFLLRGCFWRRVATSSISPTKGTWQFSGIENRLLPRAATQTFLFQGHLQIPVSFMQTHLRCWNPLLHPLRGLEVGHHTLPHF